MSIIRLYPTYAKQNERSGVGICTEIDLRHGQPVGTAWEPLGVASSHPKLKRDCFDTGVWLEGDQLIAVNRERGLPCQSQ